MSPRTNQIQDETRPGFAIRRDGAGVKMDWRTLAVVLGCATFVGGAYWTLQDHGKRIDSLGTKVEADHEILVEIRASLRGRDLQPRRD